VAVFRKKGGFPEAGTSDASEQFNLVMKKGEYCMFDAAASKRGPVIGEPAPDFETSVESSTFTLNDLKGSWIIILSHPEDMLPVFRTRTINYLLCKRRTRVISLGDENSSVAKGRNFLKKYILKRRLTMIDDSDKEVAAKYGIYGSSGDLEEMKGVFVIDPKGILRIKLYSSLTAGRNLYEILKLVDALQAADRQRAGKSESGEWRRRLGIVVRPKTFVGQR
jgi:peroxiredoxin (alkyl hydroperoxide reductase subunit C)